MWLLDTNAWVRYLNPKPSKVQVRIKSIAPADILLCDIVKAELYFGAFKGSKVKENLELLDTLFAQFESLPFDAKTARVYGQIRADLTRRGLVIGPYDMQIAAIALVNNVILVTHNVSEFSRVAGLQLEDWE
jgi:tRNA(fMet)-specific endonuclease VapC